MGSPIELISPACASHSRGGGLPSRGSSVIVLETKALNGNASSSASPNARRAAIASKVPEPLTTGCVEGDAAEVDQCAGTRSRRCGVEHGAVDADAHVAAVADAARRSRSRRRSRTPCPPPARAAPARRARRTARARPRASAAARTRRRRRGRRRRAAAASSSVTRPWWPTEPSSVAIARVRARSRAGARPSAWCGVAEAEHRRHRDVRARRARPPRRPAAGCRRRRRRGCARRPSCGASKPLPSGPVSHSSSPGPQLAQARACPDRRPRA